MSLIRTPFARFVKFLRTSILKKICKRLLLKPVQILLELPFSDNLHFWLILVHMLYFCILIYIFVWQFSLHYYWYCYTIRSSIIRTSHPMCNNCRIIRSTRPVVFCKKGFLQISQNSQENTCTKDSLLMQLQTYRV